MHHGGKDEGQGVRAQRQVLAVLHHHAALLCDGVRAEELLHILEGLGVAHHLHLRIAGRKAGHIGTMVRLHVVDHQIVRLGACQCFGQVCQPLVGSALIHGIEDGGLLVPDDIGVITDTGGNRVLALKQVDGGIVHAYAKNGIADILHAHIHISSLSFLFDSGLFSCAASAAVSFRNRS